MLRPSNDDGAKDGKFWEGDPLTGKGATRVRADWLNSLQEEICNSILLRFPNAKFDGSNPSQLKDAIIDIAKFGLTQHVCEIKNGQSVPEDLNIPPPEDGVIAFQFTALSQRATSIKSEILITEHYAFKNTFTGHWSLLTSSSENALIVSGAGANARLMPGSHFMEIREGTGQLAYRTSEMPGDRHEGKLYISHVRNIKC